MPIFFSILDYNCSDLLDIRNLHEQVKKAFCYQKLFWPFSVWINCSSDLKIISNSPPSSSNFKSFSRSREQFFLAIGKNNFGNKITFLMANLDNYCNKILQMKPTLNEGEKSNSYWFFRWVHFTLGIFTINGTARPRDTRPWGARTLEIHGF